MKIEKRSLFACVHGTYFEVPPRTKWITVDMRGFVFASENDEKPEPLGEMPCPLWDHKGHGFYVGKIRLFRFNWRDMVFDVRGELYSRDEYVSSQVRTALKYCEDKIKTSGSMGAAYCAKIVSLTIERLMNKKLTGDEEE